MSVRKPKRHRKFKISQELLAASVKIAPKVWLFDTLMIKLRPTKGYAVTRVTKDWADRFMAALEKPSEENTQAMISNLAAKVNEASAEINPEVQPA